MPVTIFQVIFTWHYQSSIGYKPVDTSSFKSEGDKAESL